MCRTGAQAFCMAGAAYLIQEILETGVTVSSFRESNSHYAMQYSMWTQVLGSFTTRPHKTRLSDTSVH
ncbi:hypothetical protein PALU110988_06930 [Paenibacillus lupini]|uniref:hypothetical protein n=1 Tax=Paenibacillus lupini TaxID=1450204 RepID=UPI0014213B87|nr:hypothetical protein [Paenibacillus lupini]NIK23257.1 hypothetical protein [Paenibacillus lupini]